MNQIFPGVIVCLTGGVMILGAILNWGIVMSSGKLIPRLLGPAVSRVVFVIIGLGLIGLGTGIILGWV